MEKQKVECEFNQSNWASRVNIYTCSIQNEIISDDVELKIICKHKSGKTNQHVEAISFWNCTISKVPQGLTKIFPHLKILEICNSELKSVEQNDLRDYRNFIIISLPLNDIRFLPGDVFTGMNNLEEIWLNYNKIEVIETVLLDGLEKLKVVDLSGNFCIDKCFNSFDNEENTTLQQIKDEIRVKFSTSPWRKLFDRKDENDKGLCSDLKMIIQNENLKDFIIQVDDEEFKVHKFLLAARSPVLKEMIENNINIERLKLFDVTKEIFREILNFIYTDELLNNNIDYHHLYIAAGRLKIENLKNFAAEKLIHKINAENAMEILSLANKYESENLREKAFEVIKNKCNRDDSEVTIKCEKLKKILMIKKEKDKMMREMEMKLKMILNED